MESVSSTIQNTNMSANISNILAILTTFATNVHNMKKKRSVEEDVKSLANDILPELIAIAKLESFAQDAGVKRGRGRPKMNKPEPAVKRARSAYILFCADNRDSVQKANKSMNCKEVTAKLGQMWKNADKKTKEKYDNAAKADKERYEKEKETAPPVQKPLYTPFAFFKKINKDKIAKEEGVSGKDLNKRMSEMWKTLSRKDKSDYKTKSIDYKPSEEELSKTKGPKAKAVKKAPTKPAKYTGYIIFCLWHRAGLKTWYDEKVESAKKSLASAKKESDKENFKSIIEEYTRNSKQITEELALAW
jgi:hypothetical protein